MTGSQGNRGKDGRRQRGLFERNHEKRSIWPWLVPLILIIAVMAFLPRLVERFFAG